MAGGYDDGYRACPCFWGRNVGSLVTFLLDRVESVTGWRVLDAGCGEGKNAVALAGRGASVLACDISEAALANARRAWEITAGITWVRGDVRQMQFRDGEFDLVIAYGLLHCLQTEEDVRATLRKFQDATRVGGYNIVCAFNDRHQDLSAHPGFTPFLMRHEDMVGCYADWSLLTASDSDLWETHPHNAIPHVHSLTRLVAAKANPATLLIPEDA